MSNLDQIKRFLPTQTVADAIHASVLRVIATGTNLVFGIVAARLVGEEAFGTYISVFAVAGLLSVVSAAGLPGLLQREISLGRGTGDFGMLYPLIQWLMILNFIHVIALLFVVLFLPSHIQLALIFIIVSNFAGLAGAVFRGYERVLLATWLGNVVYPLGALLLLFPLYALMQPTEHLLLMSQTAGALVAFGFFMYFWDKPLRNPLRQALSGAWWSETHKQILRAGMLLSSSQFLINLKAQSEIFLLTLLAGPKDVAYFYAASRAALVVAYFSTATYLMAEPRLTRLFGAREKMTVRAEVRSTCTIGFAGTLVAGIFAVLLTPIYLDLYGETFNVAAPVMYILIGSIVIRTAFGPALAVLRAARQDSSVFKITAASACIGLPISAVLTFLFGIVGAAFGSLVHSTINEWWLAKSAKNRTGFSTYLFSR